MKTSRDSKKEIHHQLGAAGFDKEDNIAESSQANKSTAVASVPDWHASLPLPPAVSPLVVVVGLCVVVIPEN